MPEEKQAGDEQLIKAIDKGMGSRIHIRLSRFHDRDYLDIRNFYEAEDGEWKPTRKGIAIPVELYGELISALKEAEPLIKDLPIKDLPIKDLPIKDLPAAKKAEG